MAWARVRTWAGVLALAIATAGCASAPPATDIAAFGAAAKQTTDLFRDAPVLGEELSAAIAEEVAARAYLEGRGTALPPVVGPLRDVARWRAAWKPKLDLLAAISAYADALAEAADPAGPQKVAAAGSNLVGTVFEVAQLDAGKEVAGVVATLGKITIRAWTAREIRAAMAEVQPYLDAAGPLLAVDAAKTAALYRQYLRVWINRRQAVLVLVQGGSSRTEQYAAYEAAVADARQWKARVEALEQAGAVVERLAAAHRKLLENEFDAEAAIADLKELAIQLKALGGALSGD